MTSKRGKCHSSIVWFKIIGYQLVIKVKDFYWVCHVLPYTKPKAAQFSKLFWLETRDAVFKVKGCMWDILTISYFKTCIMKQKNAW